MKIFKSRRDRFVESINKEYGQWLGTCSFSRLPATDLDFSPMHSTATYQRNGLLLRFSVDRGNDLVAEIAPATRTTGWFDGEWHQVSAVIEWLRTGQTRKHALTSCPEMATLSVALDELTHFCSPDGAQLREQFVVHMS